MRSLQTLLAGAIDYAGLFPPAKLDMDTAVKNYAAYRMGHSAWALGRFIVPAGWLTEFEKAFAKISDPRVGRWRLSVLLGPNFKDDITAIERFNRGLARAGALVDAIEVKVTSAQGILDLRNAVPPPLTLHAEIPIDHDPSPLLEAIATAGARAKVRTGGVTTDSFPSSEALARFIDACARKKVAFKATAGLHYPLRAQYPLTYEPDSPRGTMFGFLNLLVAAAVAFRGAGVSEIVDVLNEGSASAFHFSGNDITWRNHLIDLNGIASLRNELALSFGSCSFTEPVEGLTSLGLL